MTLLYVILTPFVIFSMIRNVRKMQQNAGDAKKAYDKKDLKSLQALTKIHKKLLSEQLIFALLGYAVMLLCFFIPEFEKMKGFFQFMAVFAGIMLTIYIWLVFQGAKARKLICDATSWENIEKIFPNP